MFKSIRGFQFFILIGVTYFFSTHPALASQSLLEDFFSNVQTLQADFEQKVVDETGMLLEFSTGQFSLSRPGKFRWDYRSTDPDLASGQQIVADGESIFMYDPDLEQVTKRKLTDALGQVPSLMLVQNSASIAEHFSVTDIGVTDGLSWVSLKPLDEDAGYQNLMLGFLGKSLSTIVLLDGLGNETRLSLSKVENNKKLDDDTFEFKIPAGADLLES
jgi:outer membrane lipoprotein carrier protein